MPNIHVPVAGGALPAARLNLDYRRSLRDVRRQAEEEVERLLDLLDKIAPDDELEEDDDFEDDPSDREPSLGWSERCAGRGGCPTATDEAEAGDGDREPSLAAPETCPDCHPYEGERHGWKSTRGVERFFGRRGGSQEHWSSGSRDEREDEHDGAEPDNEDGSDDPGDSLRYDVTPRDREIADVIAFAAFKLKRAKMMEAPSC